MSDTKCPNIKIYKCSDGFVTDNAQVAKSHEANIKSNKLICPFCQQELQEDVGYDGDYSCPNCRQPYFGSPELWQELIRTRKALDVAVDALKSAHEYYQNCVIREKQPQEINWYCTAMNMDIDIFKAIEQITALEQKD